MSDIKNSKVEDYSLVQAFSIDQEFPPLEDSQDNEDNGVILFDDNSAFISKFLSERASDNNESWLKPRIFSICP